MKIKGIDVSRWQGEINWQLVAAAGCKFAGIRATVGNYYTDPHFARNREGAEQFEIYPLFYHVVCPGNSISSQVDRFMGVVGKIGSARPVMDVELTKGQTKIKITEVAKGCIEDVTQVCGKPAMPYSNAYFWNTYIVDDGWSMEYEKWIANYRTTPPPALPRAWSTWKLWQWSNKGMWPGITGAVDLNYFNGNLDEFNAWADVRPLTLEERVLRLEKKVFG
jgi:lysozyme